MFIRINLTKDGGAEVKAHQPMKNAQLFSSTYKVDAPRTHQGFYSAITAACGEALDRKLAHMRRADILRGAE